MAPKLDAATLRAKYGEPLSPDPSAGGKEIYPPSVNYEHVTISESPHADHPDRITGVRLTFKQPDGQ